MMNAPRITMLASQAHMLREYFDGCKLGHERAAVVLFRRHKHLAQGLADSDRYLAVDIIPFDDAWVTSSSPAHISFELQHLRELFRRCEDENLVFGFAHNHPTGFPDFSPTDEKNERTLLAALANRNGSKVSFVALLWTQGTWVGRVRYGTAPSAPCRVRHIVSVGDHLSMYGYSESQFDSAEMLGRQAAAFGQPFVDMLRSLRVGVVGCGGTGSPTVTLLARAGVGELIVFDQDTLEKSNLNRVRGAAVRDVTKNKAAILRDFVSHMQLPVEVAAVETLIDTDPSAIDALASCDVVFGCTDDQIGREVMNTAAYMYAQAYIDVGLGGQVVEDENGLATLRYHFGRVSTILPEGGECLFCQGVIKQEWIRHQYALRENPMLSVEQARQRYLQGGGEQAPGVGPFTSAVADYGVANLFDLIRPFRKFPPEVRRDMYIIDFVKMDIHSQQPKHDLACPYCHDRSYLLRPETHRLNRPSLGKPNVSL